jgi:hypothetical protein
MLLRLPACVAVHGETCAQRRPSGGRDIVQSHPWWIPHDEPKATACVDVREVRRKGEGQRSSIGDATTLAS